MDYFCKHDCEKGWKRLLLCVFPLGINVTKGSVTSFILATQGLNAKNVDSEFAVEGCLPRGEFTEVRNGKNLRYIVIVSKEKIVTNLAVSTVGNSR